MKTIIFTDLDGTFLNHDNYSFKESLKSLKKIDKKKIPLIFTTSKTKTEVELLQKKVGIKEPFIIENGAAIFFPNNYQNFDLSFLKKHENYYIFQLGIKYKDILKFYNRYKKEFKMYGFSDMSEKEISEITSLKLKNAKLSKKRDFSEPFLLKDKSKLKRLKKIALKYNIKITKGGRFYHLIGKNQDKGKALNSAIKIFKQLYKTEINSIALGDGENDIEMLKSVDLPIIIQNHKGKYLDLDIKNIQKSSYKGSKGWNEMVLKNV